MCSDVFHSTYLVSHLEPCLLALPNTTRDKTELGGKKLLTEISSLISWRHTHNSDAQKCAPTHWIWAHRVSQHKRTVLANTVKTCHISPPNQKYRILFCLGKSLSKFNT